MSRIYSWLSFFPRPSIRRIDARAVAAMNFYTRNRLSPQFVNKAKYHNRVQMNFYTHRHIVNQAESSHNGETTGMSTNAQVLTGIQREQIKKNHSLNLNSYLIQNKSCIVHLKNILQ